MDRTSEIVRCLRVLGLTSGATVREIQSAFRRLARACHPDVAGWQSARKFERITAAYAFLKSLPQEEPRRESAPGDAPVREEDAPVPRWSWRGAVAWRRGKKARVKEERERAVRETAKTGRTRREFLDKSIDALLADGERAVEDFTRRLEQEALICDERDLVLRLSSGVPQVRHLALARLEALSNRREILDAALGLLQKWDIDEKTARLVSQLPLEPENRRKLAQQLAGKAAAMPDALLAYLLCLKTAPTSADRELWEQYLRKANPGGTALILRHWPRRPFVSDATLRLLLSREDEAALVSVFHAMKQRAVPCPPWGRELLSARLSHPSVAVRVWAKALLPPS